MIKTLGGLDALFLHLETAAMPMHVASLHVYRVPAELRGDLLSHIRRHLAQRLHLSPVFTRKLATTPLKLSNPAWVDDPDFDIDRHVRHEVLPAPGSRRELEQCAARLHSKLMDRSHPLWEFTLIEGLNEPDIVGFYSKVHHAAIDGQAGVVLAQAILDLEPSPRRVPPPPPGAQTHAAPGAARLLRVALSGQITQSRKLLGMLPAVFKAGSGAAGEALRNARSRSSSAANQTAPNRAGPLGFGPRTRLNVSIDGQRTFSTAEVAIADLKTICGALGGTLNDAVLALCASALRHYLCDLRELPAMPLVAAVPVSLRAQGDEEQNTQAAMFRVPLATHIADPLERYRAVIAATSDMKRSVARFKSVLPTDFPSLGMPWLLPGLASLYARSRVADLIRPPANLVISNVPGPRVPLYLAGARMLTYWPASIVAHGLALNITVESYVDTMYFGIVACRQAVPDAERLADHLRDARNELLALAAPHPPPRH